MPTLFPAALDAFNNPGANDYQDTPGLELDVLMSNALDAIEALEAKVGVNGSGVAASLDYLIKSLVGGHNHDGVNSRRQQAYVSRVYRNVVQAIVSGTFPSYITFDSESFDVPNLWVVGNPTKLTIVVPGRYRVTGGVGYASSAAGGRRLCEVHKNGNAVCGSETGPGTAATIPRLNATTVVDLAANDFLQLCAFQDSGANLNTRVGSAETFLEAQLLGTA